MNNDSYGHLPARHFAVAATSRGGPPASLALPTKGVQMSDLVLVLRRWWWRCLLSGGVLAVAAVAVVWLTFEPVYEATAYLEIKQDPVWLIFQHSGDSRAFMNTQLEVIRNPIVLTKVISEPEIAKLPEIQEADSPLDWLKNKLKAGYVGNSELCQIIFHSREGASAALVANSVMDAYLSLHVDKSAQQTEQMVKLLQDEKTKRTDEVELLKERVRTLTKQSSGQDNPAVAQIIRQSPLAGMEERRAAADVECAILRAKLAANEDKIQSMKIEISPLEMSKVLDSHPDIYAIRQKLAGARERLKGHELVLKGRSDPLAEQVTREVKVLEQSLEQTISELRPQILQELEASELAKLNKTNAELLTSIENQLMVQEVWTERIEEQRKKLGEYGEESLELEFAKRDLQRSEDIFERISTRISALRTEMVAPPRATELQRAKAPPNPLETLPFKKMAIALFGALGFPFGLAFLWERWVRRISDAEQVMGEVNLPVLGEIVALPVRSLVPTFGSSERMLRSRYTFEESVDSLRVGLTLAPELHDVQALVVTSAISQEGKTSLVSSLAVSLAKGTNESILVIDADTRAPDLHDIFGISLGPGLVEVLEGSHSLESAIVADPVNGIHLLPAGELKMNPHQLLRNGAFAALLEKLRTQYRYIIIDTPPVLLASETLVVARASDGAIICTMRDFSRGAQLRTARERLASAGVRLLGAVINGVPTPVWYQKYGSYLYSGRKYETASS